MGSSEGRAYAYLTPTSKVGTVQSDPKKEVSDIKETTDNNKNSRNHVYELRNSLNMYISLI